MKKFIVTGVNGFVGEHTAREIKSRGHYVLGISNQPSLDERLSGVVDEYLGLDLTSTDDVSRIDLSEVDAVINLAGFAKVGDSLGQGELYNKVNVGVHTVLYEECLSQGVNPRIIAVSTGAIYDSSQTMPLTENSALLEDKDTNEYVVSKKLMEQAVAQFTERGLDCIIARPLNHTGPGQLPGFLIPDLYEQIVKYLSDGQPIRVGNLEARRDFTDVRDVARAYVELALAEKLNSKLYNICSGKSISGNEVLNQLADICGALGVQTELDQTKVRPNEVMDIYGSLDRINKDVGWNPQIAFDKTLRDFVNWQRSLEA